MDKENDLGLTLLALVFALMLAFVLMLYWAWAAWVLWNWYAPLAGLSGATFGQVFAYSVLFRALRGHNTIYAKNEESKKEDMIHIILQPLCALGFGWVMLQILK